jgi:dihydroflavonol-4-reductase
MKVLVTGANGFLAGYVIRNLTTSGYDTYGMLRQNSDRTNLKDLELKCIYGDLSHENDVRDAVKGKQVIIHTAALTSQSASWGEYYGVNVRASANVIDAAIKYGCKTIIYVSTSNTIGYGSENDPGYEGLGMPDAFKASRYAYSKYLAEGLFLEAAQSGKINVVIVNPTFMLGYDPVGKSSGTIFRMYAKNKILFVPPGGRNFVHVKDVAMAICNAIESGENGQRYLLANQNLSYDAFFRRLESLTGLRKNVVRINTPLLMMAGYGGSFFSSLGIRVSLNRENARILSIRKYYSAAKAVKNLNMPQTNIDVAITEGWRAVTETMKL